MVFLSDVCREIDRGLFDLMSAHARRCACARILYLLSSYTYLSISFFQMESLGVQIYR
jgi:hypothetical protein